MSTADRHGWRKSSLSNNGGQSCVEVRFGTDVVYIRDSKYLRDPANDLARQPIITIPLNRWSEFLDHAAGYRSAVSEGVPVVDVRADGGADICAADGTTLTYTTSEWRAFTWSIGAGEFVAA
ncbi:DUF397 domain-containing protein [Nocardia altamirensis]|uniref:DUF397 domain-containing protein n=1 Tax=Nocardia altamirensis TaxID=472158 RepID=UPI00083FF33F|nr:DUF397 domain-containing protein [Nocardia altamirensis]